MADLGTLYTSFGADLGPLERSVAQAEYQFRKFQRGGVNAVKKIRRSIFSLKSAFGGLMVGTFAHSVLKTKNEFVKYQKTLETLTGSQKAAGAEWQKLLQFAEDTPFRIGQVMDAYKTMKAFGLDPTIETMRTLGDTAAALGGSDVFGRVALVLGQIKAQGFMTAQDMNQLANAGIDAGKVMKETFGVARDEVAKLRDQGVTANMIIDALLKNMKQKFGGQMQKMNKELSGQWEVLISVWERFKAKIMDSGLYKYLTGMLTGINKKIIAMRKSGELDKLAKAISDGTISAIKAIKSFASKAYDTIKGVVTVFDVLKGSQLSKGIISDEAIKNLNSFSSTANRAAIVSLKLYQGFLKLKEIIPSIQAMFKSAQAWMNEKLGGLYGWIAKSVPNKDVARKYYEAALKAKQIAADSRAELVRLNTQIKETETKYDNAQKVINALYERIDQINQKIKASFQTTKDEIVKVTRIINGKPITVYINTNPAMKALDQLETRVKHMKLSLNVDMTGTASSKKPLTEKIHDILDLYKMFPREMQINADMTSLSGAYKAIQQINNKKAFLQDQIDVMKHNDAGPYEPTSPRIYREMETILGNYDKIISGIGKLIESGYYNAQGEYTTPYAHTASMIPPDCTSIAPTTPKEAKVDIGPINITVSGTGGDRDLAITLADELDHEIAQKIIHNRSEITSALGVTAHVSN